MEKNMNKSKTVNLIGRIIFVIIVLMIISGILIYTSDRATINNQYKINEADLEIPIFLYHHIVKQESEIQFDYMQTTEETFEKQIDGLKKLGYHFISYQDLIDYKDGRKAISKNSCVLTFDDGGEDIYTNAYPILQKENIPFTMFIITDSVGKEGCANWEQLKEMQDSGLALIASHSTNHTEFDKLTVEETLQNENESYKTIEENLGEQKVKIFTYPYGLYSEEQLEPLKEAGYIINLTDNKINKSKNLNLYGLHRCYPLSDSTFKMELKIIYRSIRY